ncbi:hypothetical protein ACTXT7_004061 [Hymenolepis weldensis]
MHQLALSRQVKTLYPAGDLCGICALSVTPHAKLPLRYDDLLHLTLPYHPIKNYKDGKTIKFIGSRRRGFMSKLQDMVP